MPQKQELININFCQIRFPQPEINKNWSEGNIKILFLLGSVIHKSLSVVVIFFNKVCSVCEGARAWFHPATGQYRSGHMKNFPD